MFHIAALCPTYNRPALLASAMAMFQYQAATSLSWHATLFVLDDAGQYADHTRHADCFPRPPRPIVVRSLGCRCDSITTKYRELVADAQCYRPDAYCVWDDDDVYLPDHLNRIFHALQTSPWCKPSRVWSTYTGVPAQERADGRFWASLGIRADALNRVGGFGDTRRADFDQQFIQRCNLILGLPFDTAGACPTYCFRWGDTAAPHAQHHMRDPGDTTWYDRMAVDSIEPVPHLIPKLDANAAETLRQISRWQETQRKRREANQFDASEVGGTFDGFKVVSDADEGL